MSPAFNPLAYGASIARRYPLLSTEEQLELVAAYQAGDESAATKLIGANIRLVMKTVREYRGDLDEMFAQALEGFYHALGRFDASHGKTPVSYCVIWMRAKILAGIERNRLIKLSSRNSRALFWRAHRASWELRSQGVTPTAADVAELLDIPVDTVRDVFLIIQRAKSLDTPNEDGFSLIETVASTSRTPEAIAVRHGEVTEASTIVDAFRDTLTNPREVALLDNHLADEPVIFAVLGERFGVSKQRMHQIDKNLRARLRRFVTAWEKTA